MSRRYGNIIQSARLRPALDRYITYLNGTATRPSRVGTRGARGNTKVVFVTPFMFDIPTGQIVQSSVDPADYSALSAVINANSGAVTDAAGASDPVRRVGFSAARLVTFGNATRSTSVATSEITGLSYLKYNGDRRSCPFGRQAATDDMFDAFEDMKAAWLTTNAGLAVKRVSLQRERYNFS